MLYTFHCPTCDGEMELWQGIHDDHTPPTCSACGTGQTQRIYNSNFICDEFRRVLHTDPVTGQDSIRHGAHFNVSLGQWVESKSDGRRKAAALGLKEATADDAPHLKIRKWDFKPGTDGQGQREI